MARKLSLPYEDERSTRIEVIRRALDLLTQIHNVIVRGDLDDATPTSAQSKEEDNALKDAKCRRTLHALLDLVSLEGIYPSLSRGVGIPLEQRVVSVLPTGVVAKQPKRIDNDQSHDGFLLALILDRLRTILWDERAGIQQLVISRILPDVVAGSSELAFNSSINDTSIYKAMVLKVLNEYVVFLYLFPLFQC